MIRWLSQFWLSNTLNRAAVPSRLWQFTFGRLASCRLDASRLMELNTALKHGAEVQQQATADEPWPIGDYRAKPATESDVKVSASFAGPRPWLAVVALLALIGAGVWFMTPSDPTQNAQEIQAATIESIGPALDAFAEQVRATGRALSAQTQQVTQVSNQFPEVDRVVNDLGLAIEVPIREEMRRFADDMARPWTYLASQLPRPALNRDRQKKT